MTAQTEPTFEDTLRDIAYGGNRSPVSVDELVGDPNGCVVVTPRDWTFKNLISDEGNDDPVSALSFLK